MNPNIQALADIIEKRKMARQAGARKKRNPVSNLIKKSAPLKSETAAIPEPIVAAAPVSDESDSRPSSLETVEMPVVENVGTPIPPSVAVDESTGVVPPSRAKKKYKKKSKEIVEGSTEDSTND